MKFSCDWVHHHTENWTRCLGHLAGEKKPLDLEIGSHEGRSAIWFLEHVLTHPKSMLKCVDPWEKRGAKEVFMANLAESGLRKKTRVVGRKSCEYFLGFGKFDFVYVDGEHTQMAVLSDMVKGWEALKPGGVMIIDDFLWPPVPNSHTPETARVETFMAAVVPRLGTLLHKGSSGHP